MEWVNLLTHSNYERNIMCVPNTTNTQDVNALYSLRVAKYNKSELQTLQDLKETGEGQVRFQFKSEEQLFVPVSLNSYKNRSFIADV